MHANAILLNTLFEALRQHDHATIADCYHPDARFRDIAFDLRGHKAIHDMWRMICCGDSDIKVLDFEIVEAGDLGGRARVVEEYRFGASKKPGVEAAGSPVHNAIESRFWFQEGRILRQDDDCDAKEWARQALGKRPLGFVAAFLAGRIRLMRSLVANAKVARFIRQEGRSG